MEAHSSNAGQLASQFSAEFGCGDIARVMGVLHDKGKEQAEWQKYIQGVTGYKKEYAMDRRNLYTINMDIISNKNQLFSDICRIIESARERVAVKANVELTLMYWHIGHRINTDILGNQRAEYGKQIVVTLSRQLKEIYDIKGLDEKNIRRMMQFAEEFPDLQIVTPLMTKLTWSHFVNVLPIKDNIAREFYITMASAKMWSVRVLRDKIDGMLYERTLIAGKDDDKIKQELANLRENDVMTPDLVFKSPYFLDFTGLKGYYSERDLEDMLITGLQQFIMELGNGFTFADRQKRMIIDGEDFYLDLLFYHRKLHRLIAIDLLCCAQHKSSYVA